MAPSTFFLKRPSAAIIPNNAEVRTGYWKGTQYAAYNGATGGGSPSGPGGFPVVTTTRDADGSRVTGVIQNSGQNGNNMFPIYTLAIYNANGTVNSTQGINGQSSQTLAGLTTGGPHTIEVRKYTASSTYTVEFIFYPTPESLIYFTDVLDRTDRLLADDNGWYYPGDVSNKNAFACRLATKKIATGNNGFGIGSIGRSFTGSKGSVEGRLTLDANSNNIQFALGAPVSDSSYPSGTFEIQYVLSRDSDTTVRLIIRKHVQGAADVVYFDQSVAVSFNNILRKVRCSINGTNAIIKIDGIERANVDVGAYTPSGNYFRLDLGTGGTNSQSQIFFDDVIVSTSPAIFTDNFNRSDRVLSGDNTWEALSGVFSIVSNKVKVTTAAGNNQNVIVVDKGLADCIVSTELSSFGTGGTPKADGLGLIFRAIDDANHYIIDANVSESLNVFIKSAGTYSLLISIAAPTLQQGDRLGIKLQGATMQIVVNGTLYASPFVSSNFQTATKHGLRHYTESAQNPLGTGVFDNFLIEYV